MPPTKRKRRSKHRGNAAGGIEARGRTGRKPTPQERSGRNGSGSGGRTPRQLKPPTWNSAILKAAVMSALLFLLTRFGLFGKGVPASQSAILSILALVIYTPLAYMTDKWAYSRQQRRLAKGPPAGAPPR